MSFSLNEVEVTAKKAARGAGYSWGMAEEAGKATRWLCSNGIDGCAALAGLLISVDGTDKKDLSPTSTEIWNSSVAPLCPITAGATLSDCAEYKSQNRANIERVLWPVLLVPFASMAASKIDHAVSIKWEGFHAVLDRNSLELREVDSTLRPDDSVILTLEGQINSAVPRVSRAYPISPAWAVLNRFAHRTYAPATEESRMLGAGAGVSDND